MNYIGEKIINDSAIWDLHIHTCLSPKSSGEFQKNKDIKLFVDNILRIFADYPMLSLISFTDHNQISYEVYEEFLSRNSNINLIPGIEIDVKLPNVNNIKHLIFYFNMAEGRLKSFSKTINNFLHEKEAVEIYDVLNFLAEQKIEFIISPHAFKQDKRGIEHEWIGADDVNKNIHKYMDQFFAFGKLPACHKLLER